MTDRDEKIKAYLKGRNDAISDAIMEFICNDSKGEGFTLEEIKEVLQSINKEYV